MMAGIATTRIHENDAHENSEIFDLSVVEAAALHAVGQKDMPDAPRPIHTRAHTHTHTCPLTILRLHLSRRTHCPCPSHHHDRPLPPTLRTRHPFRRPCRRSGACPLPWPARSRGCPTPCEHPQGNRSRCDRNPSDLLCLQTAETCRVSAVFPAAACQPVQPGTQEPAQKKIKKDGLLDRRGQTLRKKGV